MSLLYSSCTVAILLASLCPVSLGAARFIAYPEDNLYVVSGATAKFQWDYHVDIIDTEFDSRSPRWFFKENKLMIGYGDAFDGRKFKIDNNSCPARLRTPTVRVSLEGRATLVITDVALADSGTYGCQLFLSSGSLSSMPTNISQLIVTETPTFIEKPKGNTDVIENIEMKINCSAAGPPTPNVTWLRISGDTINTESKGLGHALLKLKVTRASHGDQFMCQARNNPNQYPVNTTTTITVHYPPEFKLPPKNTTVTQGDSITLDCLAISRPSIDSIIWTRENGEIKAGHSQTSNGKLTVPNAAESDAGKYSCVVKNFYDGTNHTKKAYAYVVVKYQPSIVYSSSKHTVNESDSVTLRCKADGFPVPNITWTKSSRGVTLPKTGNNYTINNVSRSDHGIYTCTASNGIGNDATAQIEVIVQFKPTINKDLSNSSVESWNGRAIKLICKLSSSYPPPKWSWKNPNGEDITSFAHHFSSGSEIKIMTNSSDDYGFYTCNAENVAGSDEHMINVTQLRPPGSPNFNVTDIEASSAVVRWTEPIYNGGSKVTGYKVEIDSKTHFIIASKPNTFVIPGLTKNKVYTIKLSARNIVGYGNASSKTFTTKKAGPPASPVLKSVETSPTTVTLSWSKPEENGGEIEYYTIYKNLAGEGEWSQVGTLSGPPLTYTVKDLLPGKTYSFQVTAKNKNGSSVMGVNVKTVTLPVETTTAPTTSVIVPSKGKSSGGESDPNQPIIIAGAVVAVVLIAVTAVISIVILRKKNAFGKSGKKRESNQQSAAYHNDVDSSDSIGTGAAAVTLNDDSAPTYAAVDMTKKTKKKDEIPNYAAVDKSKKKKKPGEIIYAELADFNTNNVPAGPRPAQYTETDYADISQFQNQVEPEPTYANFPGRSKDYNI